MSENENFSDTEVLKAKLNSETAQVEWSEMTRHFARGVLIRVDSSLDLIDVACSMSLDKKEQVSEWLTSGKVQRATDDHARDWNARDPLFWCVVTAPWVLLQEKPGTSKGESLH